MEIFLSSRAVGAEKREPLPVRGEKRGAVGAFGARDGFGLRAVQRTHVNLSDAIMGAYKCDVIPLRGNGDNGSSEARELLRR